MIIDLSRWSSIVGYVCAGVVAIVLLVCIIHCTKSGIIKSLFRLLYWAIFIVMIVFLTPVVTGWLSPLGYGEKVVDAISSFVSFLDAHMIYVASSVVAILIAFLIIRAILNHFLKKASEKKFKLNNLLGFFYGALWFVIISVAFLGVVGSPLVVGGARAGINSTPVLSVYSQKVVDPIFDVFDNEGWPLTMHGLYINNSGLADSAEKREEYLKAFKHYEEFLVDAEAYKETLKDDGTYTNSKVITAIREFNSVSEVALSSDEYLNTKLQSGMAKYAEEWLNCLPDLVLDPDVKDLLLNNLGQLGAPESVITLADDKF